MTVPLVSIVISNHNYARFLRRSIDSALAQTYPRSEVIVVDDASTDDSREIITSYGTKIGAVLEKRNGGQGSAMNAGFAASHGEIIVFLDSDDWLYPHAVERVAPAFGTGIAVVQYRLHLVDPAGKIQDLYPAPEIAFDSGDVVPRLLKFGRYENTVTSGNAFSRSVLQQIMPVPAAEFRIAADGYLVATAPLYGRVLSLDEPLGAYCQHGANSFAFPIVADSKALGARLRLSLDHNAAQYRALAQKAEELGLSPNPNLGSRDPHHLASRIGSLCVDPVKHPYPDDKRLALSLQAIAGIAEARLPWKRRAVLGLWFLSLGILPRPLASLVVSWRLAPKSRPMAVDKLLKLARRATR